MALQRCFIALEIPQEALAEAVRIQSILRKQALLEGNFTASESIHLTLKFLGEIPEETIEGMKGRLMEVVIPRGSCTLASAGVFSPHHVRIIWLYLAGDPVMELQRRVDASLDGLFAPEQRFMSHITLARVKRLTDKKRLLAVLDAIAINPITFFLRSFSLKKSVLTPKGPSYTTIVHYEK